MAKKPRHRKPKNKKMKASTRALLIPEILELVLIETFPERNDIRYAGALRKVFVLQRVSRFWKNVIANSPDLQHLLLVLLPKAPSTIMDVYV